MHGVSENTRTWTHQKQVFLQLCPGKRTVVHFNVFISVKELFLDWCFFVFLLLLFLFVSLLFNFYIFFVFPASLFFIFFCFSFFLAFPACLFFCSSVSLFLRRKHVQCSCGSFEPSKGLRFMDHFPMPE